MADQLSDAMTAALVEAMSTATEIDNARLTCGKATMQALLGRKLAFEYCHNAYLTSAGFLAAAKAVDDRRALEPGTLVMYDGSVEEERASRYVVYARNADGTYLLRFFGYEWSALRQVRRQSIHPTGRIMPLGDYPDED